MHQLSFPNRPSLCEGEFLPVQEGCIRRLRAAAMVRKPADHEENRPSQSAVPSTGDCIPFWYAECMTSEQIAVRLPKDLLAKLDELVRSGLYESRAAAVRAGVEAIAQIERRREVDRSIIEGYKRTPPTLIEEAAALESLREAIAEEPW